MIVNLYIDRSETQLDCKAIMDNFMKVFTTFINNSNKSGEVINLLNKETYPTKEEGTKIVSCVKDAFEKYLETYCEYITGLTLTEEDKQYLKEHVGINLGFEFIDKEENGNSWYWLQHSDTFINQ